jgi:hypothetical protein
MLSGEKTESFKLTANAFLVLFLAQGAVAVESYCVWVYSMMAHTMLEHHFNGKDKHDEKCWVWMDLKLKASKTHHFASLFICRWGCWWTPIVLWADT